MYQTMIRETLAKIGRIGIDPRHVEAWMRLENDTLDGLSSSAWSREVETAATLAMTNPSESESLAKSFAL